MTWTLFFQLLIFLILIVVLSQVWFDLYMGKKMQLVECETDRWRAKKAFLEAEFLYENTKWNHENKQKQPSATLVNSDV